MGLNSLYKDYGAGVSLCSLQFAYSFATHFNLLRSSTTRLLKLLPLGKIENFLNSYRIHNC